MCFPRVKHVLSYLFVQRLLSCLVVFFIHALLLLVTYDHRRLGLGHLWLVCLPVIEHQGPNLAWAGHQLCKLIDAGPTVIYILYLLLQTGVCCRRCGRLHKPKAAEFKSSNNSSSSSISQFDALQRPLPEPSPGRCGRSPLPTPSPGVSTFAFCLPTMAPTWREGALPPPCTLPWRGGTCRWL